MALDDKKYSSVHNKTGDEKEKLKANFDEGHINTFADLASEGINPEFGALMYQIQQMQEEFDEIRRHLTNDVGDGAKGDAGNAGAKGDAGAKGNTGATGATGSDGLPGSAGGVFGDTIKILPNEFMSNDDANLERIMVEDDVKGNLSIRVGSSHIEMYTMVAIPQGKKVTHIRIFASHSLGVEAFEVDLSNGAVTPKANGATNTNIAFNNGKTNREITSSPVNYMAIKVTTTSTSNKIYGGVITIANK